MDKSKNKGFEEKLMYKETIDFERLATSSKNYVMFQCKDRKNIWKEG